MRIRLWPSDEDLNAPQHPGEIVYTPLQLSRLRRTAIKFQNIVIGTLAVFVSLGLLAVIYGWSNDRQLERQNEKLEQAIRDIIAARTEARLAECYRDNAQADGAIQFAREQAEVVLSTARANGRGLSPSAEARHVADAVAAAQKQYPRRSCTPEAIEAYYETRP